jgi:hypothetical protein
VDEARLLAGEEEGSTGGLHRLGPAPRGGRFDRRVGALGEGLQGVGFAAFSRRITSAPSVRALRAAENPAAPEPTTITSASRSGPGSAHGATDDDGAADGMWFPSSDKTL